MHGDRLFRKDRLGWQEVALYVKEQCKWRELCCGMSNEPAESVWARYGQTNADNDMVVACQSFLIKKKNEVHFRKLEEDSCLQALVFMGDFNHSGICWRDNTVGHKQSRRFLEWFDDNFLPQPISTVMRHITGPYTYKQGRNYQGCKRRVSLVCSNVAAAHTP